MTRLFDELEAMPEPGPLSYASFASSGLSPEPVFCFNCKQRVQTAVWHVEPRSGWFDCKPWQPWQFGPFGPPPGVS